MCTGVGRADRGGDDRRALLSGGLSAGIQKLTTGEVDWGQVGVDMAIGAAGGGTGAALTSSTTVARVATTTIGRGMVAGASEGFVSGVAYQGINYARTGEFDPADVARSTLLGGVAGGGGAWVKERDVLGPLHRTGPDTFESRTTGLVYGPDPNPNIGNRVNHVLRHTVDDPNRAMHGVFSGDRNVFDVVDDTYTRSQTVVHRGGPPPPADQAVGRPRLVDRDVRQPGRLRRRPERRGRRQPVVVARAARRRQREPDGHLVPGGRHPDGAMTGPAGHVGRCPVESNGELWVWVTRQGRLAVVCDECYSTWLDPEAIAEDTADIPAPGTSELSDGDALDRPATAAEIDAGGWTRHLDR